MSNKNVKAIAIYGRKGCQQCSLAQRKIGRDERKVFWEYVDIDLNEDAASRVTELGYQSLPVIEYGEINFSGFQPAKIEEIVEKQYLDLENNDGSVEYKWT